MDNQIVESVNVIYRLIAKLTSGSQEILEQFDFYMKHPMEYVQSIYRDYLSYDEDEVEELLEDIEFKATFPGDVMIGLLSVERFMWKVDHRESLSEIEYVVNSLLVRKGFPELSLNIEKKGLTSYAYLNAISEALEDLGLKLAFLDDGSDGFPLIITNKKDFDEINVLASQLGMPIKTYFA